MPTNYEKLRDLLRELFQLEQAQELDFGIYRIIKQREKEISKYLDDQLLPQVKEILAEQASEGQADVKAELAKLEQSVRDAGMDPDKSPKVQDLRKRLGGAVDLTALENEVFSHLYSFFRRYYSDGDFISMRRYKEGVYAIPYEGEEVKLHWANADQYYIKTSEYLRDYTFRLPSGRRVHFKLVNATTEQDNKKEQQGKERRFSLAPQDTVAVENDELVIRFTFDVQKDAQKKLNEQTLEALLGSAEMVKGLFAATEAKEGLKDWVQELAQLAPTQSNPNRTVLEKHVTDYTARNTFDYFIHKDLGKFLRREMDFYIKNEIVHLDDIENEAAPKVESYLSKVKAFRRIASKIITFLAQLEDFQKKLWLKKKFVVETNYCVTLDLVPEELYPDILTNEAQWEEWERLFAISEIKADIFQKGAGRDVTFLKANPFLVLDTAFFDGEFKTSLLASFDELDSRIDGLLVHGENFQALNLLKNRYKNQVNCLYLDPPYNTDAGPILYKNGYRTSSWLTFIADRLHTARGFLTDTGILCMTIDDYQVHDLAHALDNLFGRENQLGVAVIRNNPSGRSTVTGFSICHEYGFFYRNSPAGCLGRLPRTEKQLDRFTVEDGKHVDWRNFRKDGGAVTHRTERPKQFYPLYVHNTTHAIRIPDMKWNQAKREWDVLEDATQDETVVWPIDEKGRDRVWSLNHESAKAQLADLEARESKDGVIQIRRKHIPSEGVLPRTWWDKKEYAAREHGSAALVKLFGGNAPFSFAKSPFAVQDSLWVSGLNDSGTQVVLDYYAGSGTTAHAVLNLNRQDQGQRRYVLVEVGDYFDTVLKPRICKVIHADGWKDGKPVGERNGIQHCMRYVRMESYDDALNNLEPIRTGAQQKMLDDAEKDVQEQYILSYMLDVETKGSLLKLDAFRDPDSYKLKVQRGDETQVVSVDLVETFNYLLGLTVRHIDMIRGVRVVSGVNPDGDSVLVLWRNVEEMDSDALDTWFTKQNYNTKDMEYDLIYVNGDNNLENLRRSDMTWKVRLIEEEFQRLMFDVQDV